MNKKIMIAILICVVALGATAQKYDYHWLIGYTSSNPTDSTRGTNDMNFHHSPVQVNWKMRPINLIDGSANMSDANGQLLFYTNGLQINNRIDDKMQNGGGLNPGPVADDSKPSGAYISLNAAVILNDPGSDSLYYLFYTPLSYGGVLGAFVDGLLMTTINMNKSWGLGDVVAKNVRINNDSLGGGGIQACKHANGRDWWVVAREANTNCFYIYLLTSNSIDSVAYQCIGDTIHFTSDLGYGIFTPDGSKLVWTNPFEGLKMLNFDRCTGFLSNYLHIKVEDSIVAVNGTAYPHGISVSPNSRYLYLSTISEVRQYDLWATDIEQSEVKIANTLLLNPPTSVCFSRLAPDGKIYLVPFQTDTFMHVIHNPDIGGMACNFEVNGFELISRNFYYLPNFPNYRLGPLTGSACDTVLTPNPSPIERGEIAVHIYPNPANSIVTIDYGYLAWAKGDATLEMYNLAGQLQYSQPLPRYSALQKLNIQAWPSGMYQAVIKQGGAVTAKGRWVKGNE